MAIVNAYVLHTISSPQKRLTHENFRIELAKGLLLEASVDVMADMSLPPGRHQDPLPPHARLTERHFPDHLPCGGNGKILQRECAVCSRKKGHGRKTTYMCKQCTLPMCIVPCFELHHTKMDPQRYL